MLTSYAYYEKCNLPQFGNDRLAEIRKFLVSRGLLAEVSPTNTNQARLAEEGVDVAHHGPEEDSLTNCVRKRDWKQKGITPSRGVNECYDGGSKDRLFTGGGARVPKGLSGRAGEDHGDEDGEMGASGNGGGGDDGNGDGGDDEDGHEGTQNSVKPKLNSLQECRFYPPICRQTSASGTLTILLRSSAIDAVGTAKQEEAQQAEAQTTKKANRVFSPGVWLRGVCHLGAAT